MAPDSLPAPGSGQPAQGNQGRAALTRPGPDATAAGRTAWGRHLQTPLRQFLRTETGSAAVLLAATITALIWVNVDAASYESLWRTPLGLHVGGFGVSQDLQGWLNNGLMTFFFLVIGLEARREFDMGELRERRRMAVPLAAGLGGMAVPIVIFLVVNAGHPTASGWGTAMSTDTAFALGMLALVGPKNADRLRSYLLTFAVVDDFTTIVIIALVYSHHVDVPALLAGLAALAAVFLARVVGLRHGAVYAVLGLAAWSAFFKSGVDPAVSGMVVGLLTPAYPAARSDLERAIGWVRRFREQPTPETARAASISLSEAISPNERLQDTFHPWASYLIVPLFAPVFIRRHDDGREPRGGVHRTGPGRQRRGRDDRAGRSGRPDRTVQGPGRTRPGDQRGAGQPGRALRTVRAGVGCGTGPTPT